MGLLDYADTPHPNPHHFDAPTDPTGRLGIAEVFGLIGAKKFEGLFGSPAYQADQIERYREYLAGQEAQRRDSEERALWMQDFKAAQERGLNTSAAVDFANSAAESRKANAGEVIGEVRAGIAENMGRA